ncbi:MAG: hypothetical protein E7265_02025 [Lachnospiraceae bacterium]|nr:hypothetical protein [Lachnospiraceae bacterium]
MINLKCIWRVAKNEYINFILNPKIIILAVVYLIIEKMIIMPIITASDYMNQPVNLFEIPIATVNSSLGLLLILISYIVLISPFPRINDNIPFCIFRAGRKNWVLGEILFQFISGFTYAAIIAVATTLRGITRAYMVNGWSLVITDYDKKQLIPVNLYYQMTPYKAFFLSYLLLFLLLLFCGLLFLAGCLYSKKLLFFFIQCAHIIAGCGIMVTESSAMWFFPVCHGMLLMHYQTYFREYVFSPYASIMLLSLACVVYLIIIYKKAGKVSLDMIGGNILP